MVRTVNGIERLANPTCISYAAVRLLPYYSMEFQDYQGQSPQEIRYQLGEKIRTKRAEKEALKQATIFEKQCRDGLSLDNHQTFAAYVEYVLKQKERTGVKRSTLARYRDDLERILPAIGHMKLADIRPQHLNLLYEQLAQPGIRGGFTEKAMQRWISRRC